MIGLLVSKAPIKSAWLRKSGGPCSAKSKLIVGVIVDQFCSLASACIDSNHSPIYVGHELSLVLDSSTIPTASTDATKYMQPQSQSMAFPKSMLSMTETEQCVEPFGFKDDLLKLRSAPGTRPSEMQPLGPAPGSDNL